MSMLCTVPNYTIFGPPVFFFFRGHCFLILILFAYILCMVLNDNVTSLFFLGFWGQVRFDYLVLICSVKCADHY